jgi:hypothetical protein
VIETSDAGNGSSFATSGTAADFASMLPFCIIITMAPFFLISFSPSSTVFATINKVML